MRGTNENDDESPGLSGGAIAIGEVLAVLDVHAHRPGLLSFTRRAFAQSMPEALAELEGADQPLEGRERIVATTTRDSDPLIPYARLQVEIIDLERKS